VINGTVLLEYFGAGEGKLFAPGSTFTTSWHPMKSAENGNYQKKQLIAVSETYNLLQHDVKYNDKPNQSLAI